MRFFVLNFLLVLAGPVLAQVNVPPQITGQVPLSTAQESPITIAFTDLEVTDPDDTYPDGFTMNLSPGTNYTVDGSTITPAPGFSGTLTVPVTVNDGEDSSMPFDLSITVTAPENVRPVITGQVALSTLQDQPITIQFSDLTVDDPDDSYPSGFSMTLQAGPNYSVSGQTVTPSGGFTGTLNVPVTVNDGEDDSDPFSLVITVTADNVKPSITGQNPLTTEENTAITIQFSDLMVSDPDDSYPSGFTMTLSAGSNYSVSGRTVTPNTGFSGTLSVPVTVNDGEDDSDPFTLSITVNKSTPDNVKPVITGQQPLRTTEGKSIGIKLGDLIVQDSDDNYPQGFTLTLYAGPNYTINGSNVRPNDGFSGTLSVPVTVNDGKDSSDPFSLSISVEPGNVKPSIIGQTPLSMQNTETLTIQLNHLIVSDPDDSYPSGFTLTVYPGNNYTVTGTTIRPSANFTGILTVDVSVNDGQDESNRFELEITVNAAETNVKPVITGQQELTTFKNTPLTLRLTHLIVNDPDDPYPGDFTMEIFAGQNYSINGNSVTPASGYTGTLSVGVRVNDGTDWSERFNLAIAVVERDELRITGQDEIIINEDSTLTMQLSYLDVNDPSGKYPEGFTITITPGEGYSVSGTKVTPSKDFHGTLEIPVQVTGGGSSSNIFKMIVLVVPVNDPPEFTTFNTDVIPYAIGDGSVNVASEVVVADADEQPLVFAEVYIDGETYAAGKDALTAPSNENIRSVYDPNTGVLVLLGMASLQDYQAMLRSVQYVFNGDTLPQDRRKLIHFRLNDGLDFSTVYTKTIELTEIVTLDIPNVFTPNNDKANDQWVISRQRQSEHATVSVRVFDRRGLLVYESDAIDEAWDGKFRGENLPSDTYYYTIEVKSQANSVSKKGTVTILR